MKRLINTCAAVVAALVLLLLTRSARASSPQTYGAFMAFGGASSSALCLADSAGSIVVTTCNENDYEASGQYFELESDHTIHLIGTSGQNLGCLDVYGDNPNNGILDIYTGTCTGNHADEWTFTGAGELVPLYWSGWCVDVLNNNATSGASVGIKACNGGTTHEQTFLPLEFTTTFLNYQPTNGEENCLDVVFNDQVASTPVDNAICNGTTAQWFTYRPAPSGQTYYLSYQAELWSQNSNGTPACQVDGAYGSCESTASGFACLSQCSTENISEPSQLWNFEGPHAGSYLYQLGNAYGTYYGYGTTCEYDYGSYSTYVPYYGVDLFLLYPQSCSSSFTYNQAFFMELQAPGFPYYSEGE